jgi:hypothetical protein
LTSAQVEACGYKNMLIMQFNIAIYIKISYTAGGATSEFKFSFLFQSSLRRIKVNNKTPTRTMITEPWFKLWTLAYESNVNRTCIKLYSTNCKELYCRLEEQNLC